MIKIGNFDPSAILIGDQDVSAVYHASQMIWSTYTNLWKKNNFVKGFVAGSGSFHTTTNSMFPNCMYFSVKLNAGQSVVIDGFISEYNYGRVRYVVDNRIIGTISK